MKTKTKQNTRTGTVFFFSIQVTLF